MLRFIKLVFLFIMSIIYLTIGLWALLYPIGHLFSLPLTSFESAVGLSVVESIGYSEIAGLYGGINLVLGILLGVGVFKDGIGDVSLCILTFLTGSIAFGRFLGFFTHGISSFMNTYFLFECVVFGLGVFFIYQVPFLNDILSKKK